MAGKIRCTIVETPCELTSTRHGAEVVVKDVHSWSDPFIARLVDKYRLRAALDDSLHYLEHESTMPHISLPRSAFPQPIIPSAGGSDGQILGHFGMLPQAVSRFRFPASESES